MLKGHTNEDGSAIPLFFTRSTCPTHVRAEEPLNRSNQVLCRWPVSARRALARDVVGHVYRRSAPTRCCTTSRHFLNVKGNDRSLFSGFKKKTDKLLFSGRSTATRPLYGHKTNDRSWFSGLNKKSKIMIFRPKGWKCDFWTPDVIFFGTVRFPSLCVPSGAILGPNTFRQKFIL